MKAFKKKQVIVTKEHARLLALGGQALSSINPAKGKKGTLNSIEQIGYVQIDTLAVVNRAHHHTLWSRVPDHQEKYLNELLEKEKSIFEYWSHAASYLPMSDYRFSLPRKKAYADGKEHWFGQDKKIKKMVLDRIKAEGPLQSKDFEFKRTGLGNWYEWKPAKRALEQLFMEGKLMVARRQGFQKVYDLTERVLPSQTDTTFPSKKENAEFLIRKSIQAHGIIEEKEISYLRKGLKEDVIAAMKGLIKSGEIIETKLEGLDGYYLTTEQQLNSLNDLSHQNEIHILSPFDNLLIQRKRILNLFDFDFMIECYLPEHKRKFGYFCLPVLAGDVFVARFDPKADKASRVFYVKSMYFEKGFKPDEIFNVSFAKKLKEFAIFNGCEKIIIEKAEKNWKKEMTLRLRSGTTEL